VIWTAQEWSLEKVSTKMLAERIGVSASTASESIRKLADQGLVDHEKYGAVTLSGDRGRPVPAYGDGAPAPADGDVVVRRAGLQLGRGARRGQRCSSTRCPIGCWPSIDAKLGHPTAHPHGDPIPAADGQVPTPQARQTVRPARTVDAGTVARISDANAEMLSYFDSVGINLDPRLRVLARRDFAGMISVAIEDPRAPTVLPPLSIWEALPQRRFGWSASVVVRPRDSEATPASAASAIETRNTTVRPVMERPGDEMREEFAAGDRGQILGRKVRKHTARGQQMLQAIDTQHRREQRRHRRQHRDLLRDGVRHALILQSTRERGGQTMGEADNHQREEHADRQRRAAVLECRAHARHHTALTGQDAAHESRRCSERRTCRCQFRERDQHCECPVREIDRQKQQADETQPEQQHADRRDARAHRTGPTSRPPPGLRQGNRPSTAA